MERDDICLLGRKNRNIITEETNNKLLIIDYSANMLIFVHFLLFTLTRSLSVAAT